MKIDKDTLVAILNFPSLNIREVDLLEICLKWAENEAARRNSAADAGSKRRVFEPIKHLIRFGDLSLSEFGSVSNIHSFLTVEEIGSIFLYLSDEIPIQIDYRSPRVPFRTQVARAIKEATVSNIGRSIELKYFLNVDQRVAISSIKTFSNSSVKNLSFEISMDEGDGPLTPKVMATQESSSSWFVDFSQLSLILEPSVVYKLKFSFSVFDIYGYLLDTSKQMTLKSEETGVVFKIDSDSNQHCIESIRFFGQF